MAASFITYTKHAVAGSSSLLATEGGAHIRNIVAEENIDNGSIVGLGDWISMEKYKEGTAGAFTGTVLGKAANGNYYVKVESATNCWLVLTTPTIYEEYTTACQHESNFYNEKGDIMRCYELMPYDVFEISAEGIDGTVTDGATLEVSNKKLTVKA